MAKKPVKFNLKKISDSQLIKIYCIVTFILLVGMGMTIFFMFKYMQVINSNIIVTNHNITQTDNAIKQTNNAINSASLDIQNSNQSI
jgi:hypothetical protein